MITNIETTRFIGKKTIGLTFFLGAFMVAQAQEKQSISGKIVDEHGSGIPYTSIEFNHKSRTSLSDATLTDEEGNFTLALPFGHYTIFVDAIGFQSKSLEMEINGATNIGNIILTAAKSSTKEKEIEGITITAKASPYKVELDKKVYSVEQDLSSRGGSLQDVLNNVPSVSVESDGSVSMRGNSNVKFLINGKPSSILGITDDSSDALKNIPADQIDRIEIITNPSSKFEAEGTAGILNIILKKASSLGFNGSVSGSLGYEATSRLNTNLSWNYGKWTWFINGGGGISKQKSENISDIFYKNTNEYLNLITIRKPEMKNYNFNAGFSYNISENTSVNASFTTNNMFMDQDTSQQNISTLTGMTYRNTKGLDENKNIQVDTGFEHKFNNKGHLLSLSGSYQNSKNNSDNDIFDNRNATQTLYQYNNIANFSQKTWIGKLDYELPIGEHSKLEAGARFDYKDNNIDTYYAGISSGNSLVISDVTGSNNYTEKNSAFYAQFKSKIHRFGYQLGLRNENIYIDIHSNNSAEASQKSKSYSEFFPSAFLSYDITDRSQLGLNYSRRIKRPKSFEIIPVMRIQSDPNRFMGNADLNPSFVNSFELSYNYTRSKWNINPTLYYKRATDAIDFLTIEGTYINPFTGSASDYILSTPYNLGTENKFGLDLNYSISPTNWLRLFGNVNLFRYKNEISYNNITTNNEGNSTKAKITAGLRLDKSLNIQIQGDFRGGQKSYNTAQQDSYSMNFGISKNIWNNMGTIGFSIQDVFNSRKMKSYTDSDTFTRYAEMQMRPRQFMFTFSYRFKNNDAKESKPKKNIPQNDDIDDNNVLL